MSRSSGQEDENCSRFYLSGRRLKSGTLKYSTQSTQPLTACARSVLAFIHSFIHSFILVSVGLSSVCQHYGSLFWRWNRGNSSWNLKCLNFGMKCLHPGSAPGTPFQLGTRVGHFLCTEEIEPWSCVRDAAHRAWWLTFIEAGSMPSAHLAGQLCTAQAANCAEHAQCNPCLTGDRPGLNSEGSTSEQTHSP